MTTSQLSLLAGDEAAQRSFILGSLINDALSVLRDLPARPTAADSALEAHALYVIGAAAAELRLLPGDEGVPF